MALATAKSQFGIERFLSGNVLLTYRYVRRNPLLLGGLAILLALFLFWAIGSLIVSPEETRPLAAMPRQRPSMEYPLGTDEVGRNIFAVMVSGTALTLRIGLIAGAVGLGHRGAGRVRGRLLWRNSRHCHSRHCRHLANRARPADPDHHRRLGAERAQR